MTDYAQIPAFPVPPSAVHTGVSMRDWFAASALQGIIAKGLEVRGDRALTQDDKDAEMVRRAYNMADQMLIYGHPEPKAAATPRPAATAKASAAPRPSATAKTPEAPRAAAANTPEALRSAAATKSSAAPRPPADAPAPPAARTV